MKITEYQLQVLRRLAQRPSRDMRMTTAFALMDLGLIDRDDSGSWIITHRGRDTITRKGEI